ncbi:MAG: hypothetical protein AABZ44_06570, partial [Elusimicrobiota bacterium]
MAEIPATPPPPAVVAPKPVVATRATAVPDSIKKLYREYSKDQILDSRYWPTRLWVDPWASQSYRRGAMALAALIGGIIGAGIFIGELSVLFSALHRWIFMTSARIAPDLPLWV